MKKVSVFISFFVALVLVSSCANEPFEGDLFIPASNENPDILENFQNTFSAKLNGSEFSVHQIYTMQSDGPDDSDFIAITGSQNNYHSIILYLPSGILTGNYYYSPESIVSIPNLNVTYSNLADLMQSGIGDGHITIEDHDILNRQILGSFACEVNAQSGSLHYITEGYFNVIY